MGIFMLWDNGGITGQATEENHKKWIALESFSFGASRTVKNPVGGAGNREAMLGQISDISLSKALDDASVELQKAALGGGKKKSVDCKIEFTTTDDPPRTYLTIEMKNTMITSRSHSGGGGGDHSEQISLSATEYVWSFQDYDSAGKAGKKMRTGFDISKSTMS